MKVVIITGLTASGKSGLAMEIATKYNGEIISCDSVQVYRGLDIGSAKESAENRAKIKHHLIDIVDPDTNYNVGMFLLDTQNAINDCIKRKKLPILCGGTMMYIKALLEGYTLGEKSHDEFRKKWQDYAQKCGKLAVWQELDKLDNNLASKVHFNNLNRVVRYLEFATFGKPEKAQSILKDYQVCAVGINEEKLSLYPKINARVDQMIDMGLQKEVQTLIDKGLNTNNNALNTIGYKEMFDFLTNKTDLTTCIDLIKQHTRNYAKRQLTFMKTMDQLNIVDKLEAKNIIEKFLKGD